MQSGDAGCDATELVSSNHSSCKSTGVPVHKEGEGDSLHSMGPAGHCSKSFWGSLTPPKLLEASKSWR